MNDSERRAQRYEKIAARLEVIGKYYDLEALSSGAKGNSEIVAYYKASDFFYNLIHSRGGHNIHMGLSPDGEFHKEDFEKQAQFVAAQFTEQTRRVLEVGAGKAANTRYLAERFPDIEFTALDLPDRNFLKNRVPANATLVEGDYNDLSAFAQDSFDLVFGVETICHGPDKNLTYRQISRVLKPGGKLIVYDVYEPLAKSEMTDFEKKVNRIALAAMCVTDRDLCIGDTERYLKDNGFKDIEITDLTEQITPSLRRLDSLSGKWFRHPEFMSFMRHFISEKASQNSIAGWLMLEAFDGERLLQYDRVVAVKE